MENEITLEELLQIIIRDKGGTPQDYYDLMDYIAYHETGPVAPGLPDQRMKPDAKQWRKKDGKWVQDATGKGLFMFESHEEAGGNMASNYLAQILEAEGIDKPQWLIDIWAGKKSVDASKLTADQQKMLFLAYHRNHPRSNFSELWDGTKDRATWWADYHWSGKKELYESKIEQFNLSQDSRDAAIAAEKERQEKELKENMAPHISDSNDSNLVPNTEQVEAPFNFFKQLMDQIKMMQSGFDAGKKAGEAAKNFDNGGEFEGVMLPEINVEALSTQSYDQLSDAEKQVYDIFTNPYTGEFGMFSPFRLSDETTGTIHWRDALSMVKGSRVGNIYNTPNSIFQTIYGRDVSDKGDFRPHAITNPFENLTRGGLISNYLSGGNIYIPPVSAFSSYPTGVGPENYLLDAFGKTKSEGGFLYPGKLTKSGEVFYPSGEEYYRSAVDEAYKEQQEDYMNNLIAELAHVNPEVSTNVLDTLTTIPSRLFRGIRDLEFPDATNYTDPYDIEYKTHYSPDSAERGLLDLYLNEPFSGVSQYGTYGHTPVTGNLFNQDPKTLHQTLLQNISPVPGVPVNTLINLGSKIFNFDNGGEFGSDVMANVMLPEYTVYGSTMPQGPYSLEYLESLGFPQQTSSPFPTTDTRFQLNDPFLNQSVSSTYVSPNAYTGDIPVSNIPTGQRFFEQGAPEPSFLDKTINLIGHPFEAFKRSIHGQPYFTGTLGTGQSIGTLGNVSSGSAFDNILLSNYVSNLYSAAQNQDYGTLATEATLGLLPGLRGKGSSLYRVVDAPTEALATKYATTIPTTGTVGRRTGLLGDIQKNTQFDHISATTDPNWILGGGANINLIDRYGGANPFIAKLKGGTEFERQLANMSLGPVQNIGGRLQFENMPTSRFLEGIMPGTGTQMFLKGPLGQDIRTLIGPKGYQVAEVENILPFEEFLRQYNMDPSTFFKNFDEGGRLNPYTI